MPFILRKILVVFCCSWLLSGYNPVAAQHKLLEVPEIMRNKLWIDNDEKIIWDHSITMLSGQKPTRYRHSNVGEFTTLGYQSPEQIGQFLKDKASTEGWSDEMLTKEIIRYQELAPGGRLMIFISRYNQTKANTRWYFVILRDANDEKFIEQDLQYQAPETPEGLGWWNYYEFLIEQPVEMPFYVYLNYKKSEHLTDFRFIIKSPENKLAE